MSSTQRRSTDVDLRDYVDIRFASTEKAIAAALASTEKAIASALAAQEKFTQAQQASANLAIEKAETNTSEWKASANEWRQAMNDKDRFLYPRAEAEKEISNIVDRIVSLEKSDVGFGERRQGGGDVWKFIATGLGILLTIAAVIASYMALK